MNTPSVSCIIAVYNGRQYLCEAIESIRAQSRPVDEIIVVDDGSTDDSAAIAEGFGAPVRCIRQANAGQSAARNHGVRVSRGDMLSFLDCDDLIHPKKIERQLQRFAEAPELMLSDAYTQNFWSPEIPLEDRRLSVSQKVTHSDKPFPEFIGTWLFRREVWERVGTFDESWRFSEDSDWRDRVRHSGVPMETMPVVLARRRLHRTNLTRSSHADHIEGLRRHLSKKQTRQMGQPGIEAS